MSSEQSPSVSQARDPYGNATRFARCISSTSQSFFVYTRTLGVSLIVCIFCFAENSCFAASSRSEQRSSALHLIFRFPTGTKKEDTQGTSPNSLQTESTSTTVRLRLSIQGISPGLKKCPPDTFLPWLCQGRPLRFPQGIERRNPTPFGVGFLFLVSRTGLAPMLPP